jgi:hypothetical protein
MSFALRILNMLRFCGLLSIKLNIAQLPWSGISPLGFSADVKKEINLSTVAQASDSPKRALLLDVPARLIIAARPANNKKKQQYISTDKNSAQNGYKSMLKLTELGKS